MSVITVRAGISGRRDLRRKGEREREATRQHSAATLSIPVL